MSKPRPPAGPCPVRALTARHRASAPWGQSGSQFPHSGPKGKRIKIRGEFLRPPWRGRRRFCSCKPVCGGKTEASSALGPFSCQELGPRSEAQTRRVDWWPREALSHWVPSRGRLLGLLSGRTESLVLPAPRP